MAGRPTEECNYSSKPGVTRAAALKMENDRLHGRINLLERHFREMTLLSDDKLKDVIRGMREVNLNSLLETYVNSIKPGETQIVRGAHPIDNVIDPPARKTVDEAKTLLEDLFSSMAKLDHISRAPLLSELKFRVYKVEAEDWLNDVLLYSQRMPVQETEPISASGRATQQQQR
ncbi:hypothetical protein ACHAQH_008854 [Verticillium albo-atrum]